MYKISRYVRDTEICQVDKRDRELIPRITTDSRTPLARLARNLKVSRDTVAYRLKRLEDKNALSHYYPSLSYTRLGKTLYHVFFNVEEQDMEMKRAFVRWMSSSNNVWSVIEYSDRWDYEVTVVVESPAQFDTWLMDVTSKFRNLIIDRTVLGVLRRYKEASIPKSDEPYLVHGAPRVNIDDTDRELLRTLKGRGRESVYELARLLGVSPDTVRYRLKKMQDSKVILNHAGVVNLAALGYQWYTFGVQLRTFDREQEAKFEEMLRQHPRIFRAVKTLGERDLLIYVAARDPTVFHGIIRDLKRAFSDVIVTYETWLVREEHYYNPVPEALLYSKRGGHS